MSSGKEDLIKQVLKEFTGILQLKLPLEHICQFYDESHLNNVAQEEAKKVLMNFQNNSKLDMQETLGVVNELFPKFQDVIGEWKVKNEENKTQCGLFMQSQVDFLLSDFTTSVFIKLVSAPDVGLRDLEQFLEGRKIVLIDIFDKLSKPGEPQSGVNMKTSLEEKLECLKMETLEKQRLHLEQKATDKVKKVHEDTKEIIMEKARRLQSELKSYLGKYPKDLVKATLVEINKYLSTEGKELEEHHPQIYSDVLLTTAEVRNCLDEEDYKDMTAEEFAETLHEQLLYDFAGENHVGVSGNAMDLDSISPSDERASAFSGNEEQEGLYTAPDLNEICNKDSDSQQNELQMDFEEEEGLKQERNSDTSDVDTGNRNNVASLNKSKSSDAGNLRRGCDNPKKSKKHVSKTSSNLYGNISKRRSARCLTNSKPVTPKDVTQKRSCVLRKRTQARGNKDEEIDVLAPKKPEGSGEPNGKKLRRARKRPLNDDKDKSSAEKITYLHLNGGRPVYRCNVCSRRCFQNLLQYHGEYCGKKEMPFNCDECGRGFLQRQYLLEHAKIHKGEKPYECPKCSERFRQRGTLNLHMRSHRRGARFACKVCKLSYMSKRRLHDHNKSMHKEKLRFSCGYCNERFDRMCKLKVHVISHADVRPFRCPSCDTSVYSKYNLVKHIQMGHSQQLNIAQKVADDVAVAFLVNETKDESYFDTPKDKINSLVVSHIIKKANLKLPRRSTTHS